MRGGTSLLPDGRPDLESSSTLTEGIIAQPAQNPWQKRLGGFSDVLFPSPNRSDVDPKLLCDISLEKVTFQTAEFYVFTDCLRFYWNDLC